MRFSDIPGFSELKSKLVSSHKSGRIGHALLFLGDEGSGNLALAIAFAQFISCENRTENDSCGRCKSCVKFEKNIHPDVHFYFPTGTSKKVSRKPLSHHYFEEWREFLAEHLFVRFTDWVVKMKTETKEVIIPTDESLQIIKDLALKSYESPFRFAIIWLPEKLNISASNRLLKIIEEPPENVFFFLVSNNSESILPTILSRTQIMRVGKIEDEKLKEWLQVTNPTLSESDLSFAIKYAEGIPRNAIDALNKDSGHTEITDNFIQWARLCYEMPKKLPELIDWSDKTARLQRNEQRTFLKYGIDFFRAGLMKNNEAPNLMHLYPEEEGHVSKFSSLLNTTNTTALVDEFSDALYSLERHANVRVLFMNLSIKFGELINPKNVNL